MTKDIFGEDYFDRHRDTSVWNSLSKRKIHEVLNIKHKPKPKLDETLAKKEPEVENKTEELIDEEFSEHNKSTKDWKSAYFSTILSGVTGGLLVLLVLHMQLFSFEITQQEFWINAGITTLAGIILITIIGFIYRAFSK